MAEIRHGCFCCQTIDPTAPTGGMWQVFLPTSVVDELFKRLGNDFWNLLLCAKPVLDNPKRIFEGVRDYEEGGWCYVGIPDEISPAEKVKAPFPPGFVYAVYVNPEREVYWWCLEKSAKDDPLCPEDWQERYGSLKWSRTS